MLVLRGVRIAVRLFDILDGDQPAQMVLTVHDRELLDLMPAQDLACLLKRGADGYGDEVFLGHHVANRHVEVVHEAEVAVGDDADELARLVADRHTGDLILAHQFVGFVDVVVRVEEEGVCDDAVLAPFYAFDLIALRLCGHILMDRPGASLTCHSDGESGFGDGIHRRAH